jgi:type 2 lantibiotic biosynthesis protein LanM
MNTIERLTLTTELHTAELRQIVARSSTLHERLDLQRFSPQPIEATLLQSRLDAWGQAIAKGNSQQFQRCLAWDGITLEQAKQAVMPVELRQDAPLPIWAKSLSEILKIAADSGRQAQPLPHRFQDQAYPLPFEEILTPFVLFAQRQLSDRAGRSYQRLTDLAHAVLERALLGQLIDLAAQALDLTFKNWRLGQQSSFARLLTQIGGASDRNFYRQFVQAMLQGQLVSFLGEYTVLARLLMRLTQLWIEAQHEFLQRLNTDWETIGDRFGKDISASQVVAIQTHLSDPHRGGRSVMTLRIGADLPLVYKPKDLGIDRAYNDLLVWFNEQGCPLPFKPLEVIDRDGYGWVEFVQPLSCDTITQIEHHYQRAGMLLCLAYVLEATDCHHENLIANGEHPVLIDTETLLQPRPEVESSGQLRTAHSLAIDQIANSVARTALLPSWEQEDDAGSSFDYSGLGSHARLNRTYKGLQWTAVNTDQMALKLQDILIQPALDHVPMLNGQPVKLGDWIEAVVAGFKQMYHFLQAKQDLLLAADSPLQAMANQPIRFLFRRTNTYAKILKHLAHPGYLRDGIDRSIRLELLKRSAASNDEKPKFWAFFQAERQQMEQLDIPFFTLQADQDVLTLPPDIQITEFFEGSGFQLMLERVRQLGSADLAMQIQYIYATLGLRTLSGHGATLESALLATEAEQGETQEIPDGILDKSALLAEAIAIARCLQDRVIQAPDGSVTWLSPQFSSQQERFEFQPTGTALYDGKLGIALFLAALESMTGDPAYRDLCLKALQEFQPTAHPASLPIRPHGANLNLGLSMGLASSIFGLTQISQFLSDDRLLALALEVASLVTPDVIAQDRYIDIMGGTTGALLSLLALYQVTAEPTVLERAIACGRYLLAQSVPTDRGRAWKTLNGRLLTGFSHGAAGIAYALLRLAQATGDAEFQAAAAEGIAYEQTCFLPDVNNWSDLRDFSQFVLATGNAAPPLMSSWCHGATGIGLARLGGLPVLDTEAIRQDIQTAIQATYTALDQKQEMVDQLCCGSMGRVDFLIAASDRLSKPELLADAKEQASQVVRYAKQRGGYVLEPALHSSIYVPGFFRGEAGIGYLLLRLINPQQFPSILLLQ